MHQTDHMAAGWPRASGLSTQRQQDPPTMWRADGQVCPSMDEARESGQARCSAFVTLTEGVIWQDADGRILGANEAAPRMLGLTLDELLGRTFMDPRWKAVRPDGCPMRGEDHPGMVALRTGLAQRMLVMGVLAPDCQRRWMSVHAIPCFAPGSARPIGVVVNFVDITSQVELRQQFQEQARELRDLYEHAPCGHHLLDVNGRYLRINATELHWLGVEREQVIGLRSPSEFMSEESRAVFNATLSRILAGESVIGVEVELRGASGQRHWVQLSATPEFDADRRFVAIRSVLHDVTESRLARQALETLSARQQVLIDNDLVGIARVLDRRLVWANRAFGRMFGYEPNELIGAETSVLFPGRRAWAAFAHVAGQALSQGSSHQAEVELRRKDGSVIWADCDGAVLDSAIGETMWFSKDITVAKRKEALRIKALELKAEGRHLCDGARLHATFLSNMSHELRTPLNAIVGFVYLLQKASPLMDESKRLRYLDRIGSSANHLTTLIDNMLEMSQLQGSRIGLDPQPLEPGEVLREVADMLEPKARDQGVRVSVESPDIAPSPCLDRMRLQLVALNYLDNAIKFSGAGSIISVRGFAPRPDRLRIEVQDEGIGIAPEGQARLFVPLQQLIAGTTMESGGNGIGLALVRQIVEAQGGSVGLSSEMGRGSLFWAELPCGTGAVG